MTPRKMHADELDVDAHLVRRLVGDQFPDWAGLQVERVPSAGTDNAIFRLGDELVARLPRVERAAATLRKEMKWLPRLAPQLPLPVPVPVAEGGPDELFPLPWGVYRWLDGRPLGADPDDDLTDAAVRLAGFLQVLSALDATYGPAPGEHNSGRGGPLAQRDAATRAAISSVAELGWVDARAATLVWDEALSAPAWSGAPRWLHGDLTPGNLLADRGRLSAVIDFGCLGVGDPACDLIVAWTHLSGHSRRAFRGAVGTDEAAWARGRGWVLSWAVIYIPYYRRTNPAGVRAARRALSEVLAGS